MHAWKLVLICINQSYWVLLKAVRNRPEPSVWNRPDTGTVRMPPGAIRMPPGAVRMPPGHRPDAVWISGCETVLRFAIYSRISFCITWSDIIFLIFSMFILYMTKWRYWASSEHVICVRFISFWTFNSWITGGVGTAPGVVRTAPDGCVRTVPDCSGRLLVGPVLLDVS